jgi:succinate-acetate transporter protein
MKGFVRFVMIIVELFLAVLVVPFLGTIVACVVACPIIGIPFIACVAFYAGICHLINKAICKD